MELYKLLGLNKGTILSLVGAGGKTASMYILAEELAKNAKVLVTTTTKIYLPDKNRYDYLAIGIKELKRIKNYPNHGVYIFGDNVNEEKKIIGLKKDFNEQLHYFDYILIEADGSKQKPVKGWSGFEPVISKDTTITVGVVGIDAFGLKINESNVHRVKEFMSITNTREDDLITIDHLVSLISNEKGLFKNAVGKKVLFINKVESVEAMGKANELVSRLRGKNILDGIVVGSLIKKNYTYYGM